MKIKTFQALTMSDAIKAIKEELGSEAVILSSKQVRKGGGMFGLFGRAMVEVVAASDAEPVRATRHYATGPSESERRTVAAPSAYARDGRAGGRGAWSGEATSNTETGFDKALRNQMTQQVNREPLPSMPREERPLPAPSPERREEPALEWVKAELHSLRRLMESSLQGKKPADVAAGSGQVPPELASRYHDLVRTGLLPETAQRIVQTVVSRVPQVNVESEAAVRQALHRSLAREVKVAGPLLGLGEWKKTVIFTGPTGVGKTTTIAKLAAHYKLKEKRSVALITLDTYRVAAVEQLKMYANVIGVSLDVALTKYEAVECIRRRRKAELILIDTAGRSPMDAAGMEELRQLVDLDHPLEVHLVLSAATRERDLLEGVTRYAGLPISRLLFTKLDETTGFGGLYDLMLRSGLPLSYVSIGQNVPDDLEVVRPERLADLLLGGPLRTAGTPAGTLKPAPNPRR
ncbi:MAG: flagellar biosynthesis protein FlhF [Nitrospirae bacterium]|nr:MAG: flagellar biosynthesis protein FlhF [Nitrospirota bacterium]